jgi:hypothetical protein
VNVPIVVFIVNAQIRLRMESQDSG